MHLISSRILVFGVSLIATISSYSQGVKGRLTDSKNNPVPYTAIYDETTYAGTTCNADGYYELNLEPGNHSMVFKAMGYYLVRRQIVLSDQPLILDIQLNEQPIELKEVVITPGREDPAYAIMRKAIGLAPYHLNQVKEYTADVYLRGTMQIIKIPKIIAKHVVISVNEKTTAIKSGDVFLEESVNQVQFHAPDKYDRKVISFHSTFPGNTKDVNPMEFINTSLYQPKTDNIISPLASNAFSYYTFRYEGFFDEGEYVVFKIKVTPKHNSQQLMKGTIYIVDKLWCLHSADVAVQMFFGNLGYKIIYSPVKSNVWLPISYQFYFDAAIMGIKASGKYASSLKFGQVVLNEKARKITVKADESEIVRHVPVEGKAGAKKPKNQQVMEGLLSKDDLSNRDMIKLATLMAKEASADTVKTRSLEIKSNNENKVTVEKGAVKNDTAYWNSIRPIPLTILELQSTGLKDSTLKISNDTLALSDSTRTKKIHKSWSKIAGFITSGTGFWTFDSTLHIKYEGLIGLKKFDFNTVDGFIYRQTFNLEQKIDSAHRLIINPGIAYTFSRQRIMWWADISYGYSPLRGGNLHFHIGSESADYNGETGINSTTNSLASLFFRRNYLKLYQQNQAYITNKIDLANGLNLSATLGYRTAQILSNHSDFSFFYRDERDYATNVPNYSSVIMARNIYNEEAYWDVQLEYTPQHYYKIAGGSKHYQYSKYPTLIIRNKMAIPGIVNSTADFDLLEMGLKQRIEWGMMHAFSWSIKGGFFLNANKVFTMDDKYFNNHDLPVVLGNTGDAFRLIPFYRNATTRNFAEVHVTFTTPYLLIKYIPFLSNKIWRENIHLNYLTSSSQQNYWEVGYSISQIYMVGSIGVYAGFKGTTYQSCGLQVSVDF
jgi:hypothetical protein